MKRAGSRGQPVITLALLLLTWVGTRTWMLESAATAMAEQPVHGLIAVSSRLPADATPAELSAQGFVASPAAPDHSLPAAPLIEPVLPNAESGADPQGELRGQQLAPAPIAEPSPQIDPIVPPADARYGNPRLAGGHQLLWLAALAQLPLPPEARLAAPTMPGPADRSPPPKAKAGRFSADGWLLLRRGGSGTGAAGGAPASYGASQAGAVIRYRLAPSSALRPAAYLRASTAVRVPHDEELAAGLSVRPIKGLPVAAMAELRVTRLASGTALRPAALLVSEFPPLPLPGGFRAETYAAGGYVGGRFATPFAEGQLRVERPIARIGRAELRAGGGAWGGAQQGASRIDAGPSATLGFPLGAGGGRLSADWRFRIAGGAAPESGPALTVSAGF